MTEIVRCAKRSGTSMTFIDPHPPQTTTIFAGEIGLCEDPNFPDAAWPQKKCRELVTACVAARVNDFRFAVPLSLRGDSPVPAWSSSVRTDTAYRFTTTGDPAVGPTMSPFVSLIGCTFGVACNWTAGYVGTCVPGDTVTLTSTDPRCHVPMRVCTGVSGCTDGESVPSDATVLSWPIHPDPTTAPPHDACEPFTFQCQGDTFSTMFDIPRSPIKTLGLPPSMHITGGTYPATEPSVFHNLEGAFYGDMFEGGDPEDLDPNKMVLEWKCEFVDTKGSANCTKDDRCAWAFCGDQETVTVPYKHVYACFSSEVGHDNDQTGAEYMNDRICARRGSGCFAQQPARCHYDDEPTNSQQGAHCTKTNGDFSNCKDPTGYDTTSYVAITTYLNDFCDIVGGANCQLSNGDLPHDRVVPARTSEVDSEGGCSVGQARSGLVTLALALAALLIARGARRTRKELP